MNGVSFEPYGEAEAAVHRQIDKVRELTADNPDQQQRVELSAPARYCG